MVIQKVPDEVWGLTIKENPEYIAYMIGGAVVGGILGIFMPVIGIIAGAILAIVAFMYVNAMSYKLALLSLSLTLLLASVFTTFLYPSLAVIAQKSGIDVKDMFKGTKLDILSPLMAIGADISNKLTFKKGFGEELYIPGTGAIKLAPTEGVVIEDTMATAGV